MTLKKIDIDGEEYTLAPIKTGQMRTLATMQSKAEANPFDGNIFLVACCLSNAGKAYCTAEIEDLPFATYKLLIEAAQEICGFVTKGE